MKIQDKKSYFFQSIRFFSFWLFPLFFSSFVFASNKRVFSHRGHHFEVEKIIESSGVVWAGEFFNKDEIIFTQREGKISIFNLKTKRLKNLKGLEQLGKIAALGQGGVFDVKLHPRFNRNKLIFITYAKKVTSRKYATALGVFKLEKGALKRYRQLFISSPANSNVIHFGGSMVIRGNEIFFSVGDRGQRSYAQSLKNDNGKIHRIFLNGSVPSDNPFFSRKKARKTIYSYGHRNPQGLAFHPKTGDLWEHEHGPRGGDEINIIQKGANYGWPVVSYGKEYWAPLQVGQTEPKPGMISSLKHYIPSIAPCGMVFYDGKLFPQWEGGLLLGSLSYNHINYLEVSDKRVIKEHRLLKSLGMRVRDIFLGPQGFIYFSTDGYGIFRLKPKK